MRGLAASLDPEVHFRGPAFATPDMVGRDRVAGILTIAFERVYEDFRYVDGVETGARHPAVDREAGRPRAGRASRCFASARGRPRGRASAVIVRPAPGAAAIGEAILKDLDFDPRAEV